LDLARVSLEDKYALERGRIYLTGIQALVRLPMMQRQRDRAAGLNTAGFISGYRGSPLGGYDNALWQARELLEAHDICFQPGLNEDLAATAVWGSQQVGLFPGAKVAGVFGIWYGKGPGIDRSTDALRTTSVPLPGAGSPLMTAHRCTASRRTLPIRARRRKHQALLRKWSAAPSFWPITRMTPMRGAIAIWWQ
jgi:hypothetical protein